MAIKTKKPTSVEEQYPEVQSQELTNVVTTEGYEDDLFTIVNNNGEFLIAVGNNIVSRKRFDDVEKAKAYIDSKPWDLIINICSLAVLKYNTIIKNKQ